MNDRNNLHDYVDSPKKSLTATTNPTSPKLIHEWSKVRRYKINIKNELWRRVRDGGIGWFWTHLLPQTQQIHNYTWDNLLTKGPKTWWTAPTQQRVKGQSIEIVRTRTEMSHQERKKSRPGCSDPQLRRITKVLISLLWRSSDPSSIMYLWP